MTATEFTTGTVVRRRDLDFSEEDSCWVSRPIGPHIGAQFVSVDVVRVPPGRRWMPAAYDQEEINVVVFSGSGRGQVGEQAVDLSSAASLHAPTGTPVSMEAAGDGELTAYIWRSVLRPDRAPGRSPRTHSSLWNDETQLVGFAGTGQIAAAGIPATMNFIFWPGTGSSQLCLHCGIQQKGETFNVHVHPESEDAFLAFEGVGQMYLLDRWIDVEAGDLLFAPPLVPHGARNPRTDAQVQRFVTCGGPTPFDPYLYECAGVSAEVR